MGPFAEQRARPVLGERFAVPVHPDHPVQDQVDVGSLLALPDQRRPGGHPADDRPGAAVHQLHRQ